MTIEMLNCKNFGYGCPHRIGDILCTMSSENPATSWPGTSWEQIPGRFLIGDGAIQPNSTSYWGSVSYSEVNCSAGEKGGAVYRNLSAAIGATNNNVNRLGYITEGWTPYQGQIGASYSVCGVSGQTTSNLSVGVWNHSTPVVEQSANRRSTMFMPPYLSVHMWKRTA